VVRALYDVHLESFVKIEGDTETLIEYNCRIIGRQHLLNCTIVNHVDMDDTFEVAGNLETFVNGEWKDLPMRGRFGVCAFMNGIYVRYWQQSFKDSNMPKDKDVCPFKKGEYYLRNVELQTDNWAGYVRRGKSRLKFIYLNNNVTIGGFEVTGFAIDRTF
ncbi:hypothetical protein KR038_009190, partial [Drosophila bunnanda]